MAKYKLINFLKEDVNPYKISNRLFDYTATPANMGSTGEELNFNIIEVTPTSFTIEYRITPNSPNRSIGTSRNYRREPREGVADIEKDFQNPKSIQVRGTNFTVRSGEFMDQVYGDAASVAEAEIKTDIGTVDTDFYPQQLSKVSTSTAKVAVTGGKKDKDDKDDSAIASKIKTGFSTPVSKLFPAQTEVIPEKAVGIALGMLNSGKVGGNLGAIVSGDNHIMDGHHRWAATTLVDPNASVEGIKIDIPGDALVGILNVYTKGALGRTQGNPGKGNVNAFTPEKIKSVLDDLIEKGTKIGSVGDDGSYSEKEIGGEEVKNILGKMKGANGDPEKGKELMAANAAKLNKKIPSWAPPRVDMPVINSDELGGLINKLKSGEFDIVEPYSLQVRVGRKDKEDEEPVAEGLDYIHMMKVRAGIIK